MKPNDAVATARFGRPKLIQAAVRAAILGLVLVSPLGAPVLGAIELHLNPDASVTNYFVLWWWHATVLIMVLVGLVWWLAAIVVAGAFALSLIYLLVISIGASINGLRA